MITWASKIIVNYRKGIEDVIVSMGAQGIAAIAGFIGVVILARGLGPEEMGKYVLVLSVPSLVIALSDLGIGQTAIRYASMAIANTDSNYQFAILRWSFRLRFILIISISFIIFIASSMVANILWGDPNLAFLIKLSLLISFFTAMSAVPAIYFQSLKLFKMNGMIIAGQSIISLLGIVVIGVLNYWPLKMVILVSAISTGIAAIISMVLVPKASFFSWDEFRKINNKKLTFLWDAPKLPNYLRVEKNTSSVNMFALYMVFSSIFISLIMRADIWIMGYFLDKNSIGIYSVASRVTLPLIILLGGLNTALWPRVSSLNTISSIKVLALKIFKLSALVASLSLVYAFFAPFLIPIIFGVEYEGTILLGQILCVRYCFAILTCPLGVIGYSLGMVKEYWWINFLQLTVVLIINFFLIPKIGIMGSALALIANEVVGFILVVMVIRIYLNKKS